MNFVKSFLTLAAMTLIVVGLSGNTCIYNAPACSTITDQGGCIAPICAWTAANACVAATAATCGAQTGLTTGAAAGDCSVAATDSTSCAAVKVKNGPTGTASSVCSFTSGTASCVPNIDNEASVCPTLANKCTVNAGHEATACAAFSTQPTCDANNPYCAWNGSSCAAVSPGTCTVNVTNEATACNGIFDADRCVQSNGAFCIWDNNTGLCGPRSTSAPSSGQDFDACAAVATSAALCNGVLVNGTSVCTASSSQIGNDVAACAAANTDSTACAALVVGSTTMCSFTASTCTSGSNANFCTDLAADGTTHVLTTCNPLSTAQPGSGLDFDACAAAATSSGACAAVTVGSSAACTYFTDTCSVNTTAGVTATACGTINVIFCGAGTSADFCQINAL